MPQDIRRALGMDEFFPFFQPLVNLRTGCLTGLEVLARWVHPTRGSVPPNEFILTAEANGLIDELMQQVLGKAFVATAALPSHLEVAVNISAIQLREPDLAARLIRATALANFPLNRLTIEITESALFENLEIARATIQQLKSLGVRLAIDDFGTGHSSLTHLQALPFDIVKVDRGFVSKMTTHRESRKIVAAVLGLGQSLGFTTIAEGVEDLAQADMLFVLGCDIVQGYLYGKPVPSDQLAELCSREVIAPAQRTFEFADQLDTRLLLESHPTHRLAHLKTLYDDSQVGIGFLDCDLRYISLNQRLADINGFPILSHIGKLVSEIVPAIFDVVEPYLKLALSGSTTGGVEQHRPVSGSRHNEIITLGNYQPVIDENHEVLGVSILVVDITDRKFTELALRGSEEHYRNTVELSPHVTWTATPDGLNTSMGARWQSITGLSEMETLNNGWAQALHPDDLPNTLQTWSRSLLTGQDFDTEYRVRTASGQWCWYRARASAKRDAGGTIGLWYGVTEDINTWKQEHDALRASNQLLDTVFDSAPVGLMVADASSGCIMHCNSRSSELYRTPAPVGRHFSFTDKHGFDVLGHQIAPNAWPIARAILNGESTTSEQILFQRGDGTYKWGSFSAAPIRNDAAEITGGVLVIQDSEGPAAGISSSLALQFTTLLGAHPDIETVA